MMSNADGAPDQPTESGDLSTEEYGSLTVEDDPDGTVDRAELANTADESDHDLPDSGTQPDQSSSAS
jgi:hypothetical protein